MSARTWLITALLITAMGVVAPRTAAQDEPADRRARLRQFIERFDDDGDGRLSASERAAMRKFLQELRGRIDHEPIPQTVFPGKTDLYKLADGPHEIAVVETYMLRDAKRDKQIPLRLTFPRAEGKYPLIVFCHGAMGSKDAGQPLATFWASHGYVVIQPTFGDSISLMTAQEKSKVRSLIELVNSPRVMEHWDDRPRDVKHVLDSLHVVQRDIDGLAGKIDAQRIAVAGHSFGAHTTMLLAGLTLRAPGVDRTITFRDDRIQVSVMISPQGTGKSITPESYTTMQGPILMITGDHDGSPIRGQENHAGEWRKQAFDHAPPGDKYLLWIDGAYHGFGGINGSARFPGAGPVAPDHVYFVKSTALAMFDAYLRGDAAAKAYLASDKLATVTEGKAKLAAK